MLFFFKYLLHITRGETTAFTNFFIKILLAQNWHFIQNGIKIGIKNTGNVGSCWKKIMKKSLIYQRLLAISTIFNGSMVRIKRFELP